MKNTLYSNLLKFTAMSFLLAGFITACSDNDPVAVETEPSIADIVASTAGFETLNELLETAGLTEVLQGGEYTVFAPTDDAFAAIPEETLNALTPAQITDIILFHALPTVVSSNQLQPTQDVTSAQGEVLLVQAEGGVVTVNGSATVQQADIEASNGIVHVIDEVLLPSGFREPSLADLAAADGRFTALLGAVEATGLTTTLTYLGPFTVFAPTDEAFEAISATVESLTSEQLLQVLTYHVLPAVVESGDLQPEQTVATVNGQDITIEVNGDGAFINDDSEIIETDLGGANGVIHVIDAVLIPDFE